jgi:3-oxoacyl-[acyl-carrier protein] reductase
LSERKIALVTGASRGIGAACAAALAAAGYSVAVNYHKNREAAERLAAELGGRAFGADVSDEDDVARMFEAIGGVDVLVCNAGIALAGLFTDTARDWRRVIDVNVGGVINCCRAAIPHMISQKSGCIVTVSSMWGVTGASCEAVYSASKAAVIGLTKSLAKELGPSGIRVNCAAPGVIDTGMNDALTDDDLRALKDETPLGVIGAPRDVAALVRFLSSEEARFITGQVVSPTGGLLI